jgi:hypothetical protein
MVCRTSSINTRLLATYFTGSHFISIWYHIIFIYQCNINNLLHTLIFFLSGWWHTLCYLQISFVAH